MVSTMRLTGNDPEAQELLEQILEESKPPLPADARDLHYLLATPYRYPPLPRGSRFRAWPDPGVLYAASERRTACAEMGYWRWRFVADSDGLSEISAAPQTVFQVGMNGPGIDLRVGAFASRAALWTNPGDYSATQWLGRAAREEAVALIVYESVRDPERGACVAALQPSVFRPRRPVAQETWHLTVTGSGAVWQREGRRFVFRFGE